MSQARDVLISLKKYILNCGFLKSVSYDHRSYERSLSGCVWRPEGVGASAGFGPVTSRCRWDALAGGAVKPLMLGAG